MSSYSITEKLKDKIKAIVENNKFNLYHLEYIRENGQNILRAYIDSDNGVGLNDCVAISRGISDMLDIEDPITEEYNLEVSSPGVFRTLFTEEHYNKYIGYDVEVKLSALFEGKKKFQGKLLGFDDENITLEVDDKEVILPKSKISTTNLNPAL